MINEGARERRINMNRYHVSVDMFIEARDEDEAIYKAKYEIDSYILDVQLEEENIDCD